jgi:hypothetical protein
MPQFLVMRGKLNRDGKTYKTGDKVELPWDVANRIQGGMLEPVTVKAKSEPVRMIPPEETPTPSVETTESETRTRRKG